MHGLVIRSPWVEMILDGKKSSEIVALVGHGVVGTKREGTA